MKQYGTAPGQNNYTPDFLQHFDQKDGGEAQSSLSRILEMDKTDFISRTSGPTGWRSGAVSCGSTATDTVSPTAATTTGSTCLYSDEDFENK